MRLGIDRDRVQDVFRSYTEQYDVSDKKVKLKIDHTYRVAALCERIAKDEKLTEEDVQLAWLLGMLHDLGRFEQLRQYGTFIDAKSVDHAALGADILFREGKIRDYVEDGGEDTLIETAICVHNAYRIPKDLDVRTVKLCNILRDADKIDILKVNVEVPIEEIYMTTTEKLKHEEVSDMVMQSFSEHHAVLGNLKRTTVDYVVGIISLVFELVFPVSLRIVTEQGYLWKLLDFASANAKTREQFAEMRDEMYRYCRSRS